MDDPSTARQLADSTHFTSQEISGPLAALFRSLPRDGEDRTSAAEVLAMPEVAMFPMVARALALHSQQESMVDFAGFVRALSTLSGRVSLGVKVQLAFEMYTLSGRGSAGDEAIEARAMFNVFRLITGRQYTDDALTQIVDSFLERYPRGLSRDDFFQMFAMGDCAKLTMCSGAAYGAAQSKHGYRSGGDAASSWNPNPNNTRRGSNPSISGSRRR